MTYQGYVYFTADDGTHGRELWRTNGVTATLVADLNATPGDSGRTIASYPGLYAINHGKLYFFATGTASPSIWSISGHTSAPIPFSDTGDAIQLMAWGDYIYFASGYDWNLYRIHVTTGERSYVGGDNQGFTLITGTDANYVYFTVGGTSWRANESGATLAP